MNIKNTMILSGAIAPEVVRKKFATGEFVCIPFILSEEPEYRWIEISLRSYKYNYDNLVDAVIGIKYSYKEMFAILNNYLLDPKNSDAVKAFNDMQEWRKTAKDFAKKHFNMN